MYALYASYEQEKRGWHYRLRAAFSPLRPLQLDVHGVHGPEPEGQGAAGVPQEEHVAQNEAVLIVCEFGATVPAGGGHLGAYIDHVS